MVSATTVAPACNPVAKDLWHKAQPVTVGDREGLVPYPHETVVADPTLWVYDGGIIEGDKKTLPDPPGDGLGMLSPEDPCHNPFHVVGRQMV